MRYEEDEEEKNDKTTEITIIELGKIDREKNLNQWLLNDELDCG